jgi:hypothetical protein
MCGPCQGGIGKISLEPFQLSLELSQSCSLEPVVQFSERVSE